MKGWLAEAIFKAVFVGVFVVGVISAIEGKFLGWPVLAAWVFGTFVAEALLRGIRRKKVEVKAS